MHFAGGPSIRPRRVKTPSVAEEWGLRFVILYSASLGYSSNLDTVIDAMARAADAGEAKLVVVGEGVKN